MFRTWLIKMGLGFLAGLFRDWLGRLKRDSEMRREGAEAVHEASENAANERKRTAEAAAADYDALGRDDRERLRESDKHYRD